MEDANQDRGSPKSTSKSPPTLQRKRTRLVTEKKIADDEFMAAAIGDMEWLRQSMRANKGVVTFDNHGLAPIHLSAIHGRLECLRLLVEKFKVDVNLPSATGWRPVHLAISNQTGKRSFACLRYLLEKGADPSITNEDKLTAVHQAASEGHVQCLKLLIDVGARLGQEDNRGHKPIDLAKLWGHKKCARMLAAEMWHQEKDDIAKEFKHLQKVKMQQVLKEIEADEEIKADQQFYGNIAFNQWLKNRNLSPKPTMDATGKQVDKPVVTKPKAGKYEDSHQVESKESLQKPNSQHVPPPRSSPLGEKSAAGVRSPNEVSAYTRRSMLGSPGFRSSVNTPYSRGSDEFGDPGLFEKVPSATQASSEPDKQASPLPKHKPGFYNPISWNKSPKVPQKAYVSILPDHYPRDEYTMKPKFKPQKRKNTPSLVVTDEREGVWSASMDRYNRPIRVPKLPQSVIDRAMAACDPSLQERPVMYKPVHIFDVHTRKHYDLDELPRSEAMMHLQDNPDSVLYQMALQPERIPSTPSTGISGISHWSQRDEPSEYRVNMPQILQALKQMSKPGCFPDVY